MPSRQVIRQMERQALKRTPNDLAVEKRNAQRALLERQTAREKSGFYDGQRAVAACLTPSRSRIHQRRVKKGQPYGRILFTCEGKAFHATKGWRKA